MKFEVYGPYKIDRVGPKKLITDESLKRLKDLIDDDGLIGACGCYLFAIRAGQGYKPWYVGQASKSKLLKEALNPRNREIYNKVIAERAGTPVLFLIPKLTKRGDRFAAPTQKDDGTLKSVDFLEEWLIASSLQKNPKLINRQNTFFLKNLHVVGIFNPNRGEATNASSALRKTIY